MIFVNSQRLRVKSSTSGFTLVEMLVAFGIFAIIMVISTGSLISLLEANRKAQTLKTVVNNLHFALENMSRNIRTGHAYRCSGVGAIGEPLDCPKSGGSPAPSNALSFTARGGTIMIYRLNSINGKGVIERSADAGNSFIPITAPEINVDQLNFYVSGSCPPSQSIAGCKKDTDQPRVLIIAKGFMESRESRASITRFDIQTLVSQRQLDI